MKYEMRNERESERKRHTTARKLGRNEREEEEEEEEEEVEAKNTENKHRT